MTLFDFPNFIEIALFCSATDLYGLQIVAKTMVKIFTPDHTLWRKVLYNLSPAMVDMNHPDHRGRCKMLLNPRCQRNGALVHFQGLIFVVDVRFMGEKIFSGSMYAGTLVEHRDGAIPYTAMTNRLHK